MYFTILLLVSFSITEISGEECVAGYKCYTRSEAPAFATYFKDDGHCFTVNKTDYCLFNPQTGGVRPCDCSKSACRCGYVAPKGSKNLGQCVAGVKCYTRKEAPQYANNFQDDGQCLKLNGIDYCLHDLQTGNLTYCDCSNAACQCGYVAPKPSDSDPSAECLEGHKCIPRAEAGDYAGYYYNNGPCMKIGGKDVCMITHGYSYDCDCKKAACRCYVNETECFIKDLPQEYAGSQYEYCQRYGSEHTMCKVNELGPSCGSEICTFGMTVAQKNAILDAHNEYRRKVAKGQEKRAYNSGSGQPPASNMKKMRWNNELARVSGRQLATCIYGHDKLRNIPSFGYVGQNIYLYWSGNNKDIDVRTAVDAWYAEVAFFDPIDIKPFGETHRKPNSTVGHYTQVVWADTDEVGCAYLKFKNGTVYSSLITCDYGPGGNVDSRSMYEIGAPGSACNGATEDGLCL